MLCHSVRSCRSPVPLSFHESSVAIEKRQNGVPLAVYFNSGSRPRRPTRITLLTDFAIRLLSCLANAAQDLAVRGLSPARLWLRWYWENLWRLCPKPGVPAAFGSVRRGRGLSCKGRSYFYRSLDTFARRHRTRRWLG